MSTTICSPSIAQTCLTVLPVNKVCTWGEYLVRMCRGRPSHGTPITPSTGDYPPPPPAPRNNEHTEEAQNMSTSKVEGRTREEEHRGDGSAAWGVYCHGPLLEAVQSARLFPDSKTFVDMPMKQVQSGGYGLR